MNLKLNESKGEVNKMKYQRNNKPEDLKSPKKGLEDPFYNVVLKEPENILEWIDYLQKMKPQTNALVTGIMLMLFNGMHLGWGIFNNRLLTQQWTFGLTLDMFWLIGGWFVAAIFGFVLTASIFKKTPKMTLYVSCFNCHLKAFTDVSLFVDMCFNFGCNKFWIIFPLSIGSSVHFYWKIISWFFTWNHLHNCFNTWM